MTASDSIGPTPERLAKAGDAIEAAEARDSIHFDTIRLLDGSPLQFLALAGKRKPAKGITGDQFYAGCRYYEDAYRAGLLPSPVIDMTKDRVDGGGHHVMPDYMLAAQTRFNHALRCLDPDARDILSDVVLNEAPLTVYANQYRKFSQARERRAIALNLLRKALDQLVAHYYPPRRGGTVSSRVDGYRPGIPPAESG